MLFFLNAIAYFKPHIMFLLFNWVDKYECYH
ncbi:Uncharacterised protein [Leminorella grimontii]|nr:Uncharacterised protein [Leminorella grimontii]